MAILEAPRTIVSAVTPLIISMITVPAQPPGTYLYHVDLQTFITHTFPADLDITISHGGTTVTLTTDNGGGNDNVFNGTVWDDAADPDGIPTSLPGPQRFRDECQPGTAPSVRKQRRGDPSLAREEGLAGFIGDDPSGPLDPHHQRR